MNKQIPATFTILLFALAITSYAYNHWQEILNIQGTIETAKTQINIQNHNTTLNSKMSTDNRTLEITDNIALGTIWTGIIIKNNGTIPTTITLSIQTNDTSTEIYFSNQTYFYGPYTTIPPEVWENSPILPPPDGQTTPPELPAQNMLVIWQKITLNETPPQLFIIKITVTYKVEFQSWTDTVSVIYTLTYPGAP